MENIHSMHYLTKQITDKEKCVCFPPVKLYLHTESEVAELAGQTNSPPSAKGNTPFSYRSSRIQQFSVY